jgi:hypothetical protein
MNEKPIERLKFYNGQRLEADDLKLEQEYHMRVRRWLNKSLYSAGIAHGLEVHYEPGRVDEKGRAVLVVTPGLALDMEGREMILVDEGTLPILGKGGQGAVTGNYIFIQYNEQTRAEEDNSCNPRGNGKGQLAWGGPSRVRATPILGWSDEFPHESSGKVVLAQVELNNKCEVENIFNYPRHYIGPASNAMVRQYALEGERHIDAKNPGRIYFHIRGRQPNAVTLYLRAEKFSMLYYTEMGQHKHVGIDTSTGAPVLDTYRHSYEHQHTNLKETLITNNEKDGAGVVGHSHLFTGQMVPVDDTQVLDNKNQFGLMVTKGITIVSFQGPTPVPTPLSVKQSQHILNDIDGMIFAGEHSHPITGSTDAATPDFYHTHTSTTNMDPAGVTDPEPPTYSAHSGAPLTYVDDLQIYISKAELINGERPKPGPQNNFTTQILTQLKNANPLTYGTKNRLGEGKGDINDPLANNGTGPIRLDLLSNTLAFPEGEYYIELKVASGGGRILYNLYIE